MAAQAPSTGRSSTKISTFLTPAVLLSRLSRASTAIVMVSPTCCPSTSPLTRTLITSVETRPSTAHIAFGLLGAALPAAHGAPRPVRALLARQPARAARDGGFAVGVAGELQRVQRLPGGERVALRAIERPAAVLVLAREQHLLQAQRALLRGADARGDQAQQREVDVLDVDVALAVPLRRLAPRGSAPPCGSAAATCRRRSASTPGARSASPGRSCASRRR